MRIVRYASDLGLKPGEWPRDFDHDGRHWAFHKTVKQTAGIDIGNVAAVVYRPTFPNANSQDELHVLND
jgi:hypothetical protein